MTESPSLRDLAQSVGREARVYRNVARDRRTPRLARWLLATALGYMACPIDLVPDFLPVVGHLDDLVIVPGLIWAAIRMVPAEVLEDARAAAGQGRSGPRRTPVSGIDSPVR